MFNVVIIPITEKNVKQTPLVIIDIIDESDNIHLILEYYHIIKNRLSKTCGRISCICFIQGSMLWHYYTIIILTHRT